VPLGAAEAETETGGVPGVVLGMVVGPVEPGADVDGSCGRDTMTAATINAAATAPPTIHASFDDFGSSVAVAAALAAFGITCVGRPAATGAAAGAAAVGTAVG